MPDWTRSPPTPPTIDLTGPPEPPRARAPLTLPTRSVEIIEIDSNDEDSDVGGSHNNNYISSGDDSDSDGDDVLFVRENPAQAGPSNLHEYFNGRRVPVMPRAPRPQRTVANEYVSLGRERGNVFGTNNNANVTDQPQENRGRSQVQEEATTRARSARREADSSHSLDAQIAAAIASGGRVQHHHHHHHHVVRPHHYNNPADGAPQQQQRQRPHNQQRHRHGPLRVLDDAILGMLGMVGVEQMSAFDQFVRARDERRIRQRSESMFRDDATDEIDFYRLHQEMEDRAQAVAAEARAAAAASRTPDSTTNDELEPGFTKALTLDTVVICPTCQLPFGHSGVETAQLWVIWGCGHVICGDCVDSLFITKTEIKSNQESLSKASPSKNGRGKGRAKNKASAKMASEDDGGADVNMSEQDPATKEDPEAEKLYKITKKQYGNCPCCNRKVKRSSIVRLYH